MTVKCIVCTSKSVPGRLSLLDSLTTSAADHHVGASVSTLAYIQVHGLEGVLSKLCDVHKEHVDQFAREAKAMVAGR